MDAERITSVKHPLIKWLRQLGDRATREKEGLIRVEGGKMIAEALACRLTPGIVLYDEEKRTQFAALCERLYAAGAEFHPVTEHVLKAATDTVTPQGVVCAFAMPAPLDLNHAPARLVALDGVQDPGNVGTIWRTADAAGFQGMLLGAGSADPFSPKVVRAAMGSGFRVPVWTGDLPDALGRLSDHAIIASVLDGQPFFERPKLGKRIVLVIGSEARGVSDAVSALATMRLKLPMPGGAESLNAAVAAGIMLYDIMRGAE